MQIYGSTPRVIDRSQWGFTYDSANRVGSHPADVALATRGGQTPDVARDAAVSALRNERFGSMLEQISNPAASDVMIQMQSNDRADRGTDHGAAFAAYGENS